MKVLRKLREENGSITMTVVAAMLLIIACITIAFMSIFNKNISQNSKIRIIEKNYADSSSNEKIKEQYNDTLNRLNSIINVRLYKSSSGEEYSVDQWTNDNLKLNITWDIPIPEEYKYFFYNGVQTGYSDNYEINENCTISVGYGNDKKIIEITKLDKNIPQYTIAEDVEYNPDGTSKESNTLITYLGDNKSILTGISVGDNESGIAPDGVKCYKNNSEISTTDFFTQVGRYEVDYKVKDNAGNETTLKRDVLVRWPLAGKYVVKKTELDGVGIAGVGDSSSTSPDGLYKDTVDTGYNSSIPFSSKYYYTGANVSNYISFAGKTFRIFNIALNDDVKLLGDISDVGTSWGSSKIFESNVYNTWSTKWWPRGQIYNNANGESKYFLFPDPQKIHLDLATFFAGRVDKSDNLTTVINNERTNATNLGGSSASFQGYSAYPNASDFLKASKCHDIVKSINDIDTASVQSRRTLFKNNSWVDMTAEFWTMNGRTGTLMQDSDFWVIDNDLGGHFESRLYSGSQQYRVVFYLKNDTILSGTGTSTDPYKVEENWAWFDSYQQKQ